MILFGERVDAATALRIGLVEETVPKAKGTSLERALALAARVALQSPDSVAACKGMVQRLHQLLDQVDADASVRAVLLRGAGPKAFCAGGDVMALANSVSEGTSLRRDFFVDEYRLDLRVHAFPKPIAVLMHGLVMGGGMGLAQGAALRLVTDSVRVAMPETRIGLVPDVGSSHFFSKMPAPLSRYLALTGVAITTSDTLFVGLADARCRVNDPAELSALLALIEWPDGEHAHDLYRLRDALALELGSTDIGGALLPERCAAIYPHFDPARSLAALVEGLTEGQDEWSRSTLEHQKHVRRLFQESPRRRTCLHDGA